MNQVQGSASVKSSELNLKQRAVGRVVQNFTVYINGIDLLRIYTLTQYTSSIEECFYKDSFPQIDLIFTNFTQNVFHIDARRVFVMVGAILNHVGSRPYPQFHFLSASAITREVCRN